MQVQKTLKSLLEQMKSKRLPQTASLTELTTFIVSLEIS